MENDKNKKTPQQRLELIYATCEGKTDAEQVLKEILPLIEDYFVCNAEIENFEIKVQFYNGQKFRICVKED